MPACPSIEDETEEILHSLAKLGSIVEPAAQTAISIGTSLYIRQCKLLEKKKHLYTLKSQTADFILEQERIKEVKEEMQDYSQLQDKKLLEREEILKGVVDLKELQLSTHNSSIELETENERYNHIAALEESIYSEDKMNEEMCEIKDLYNKASLLAAELEFTEYFPPNLREISFRLDKRKEYYKEITKRVEVLSLTNSKVNG